MSSPHKCPCCDGYGRRAAPPFEPSALPLICVACHGAGVLWALDPTPAAPQVSPYRLVPMPTEPTTPWWSWYVAPERPWWSPTVEWVVRDSQVICGGSLTLSPDPGTFVLTRNSGVVSTSLEQRQFVAGGACLTFDPSQRYGAQS